MNPLVARLKSATPRILVFFIFIMIAFVVVPKVGLDLYYEYFDRTEYLTIESPVGVDTTVHYICDTMILTVHKHTLMDLQANSVRTLVLVDTKGNQTEVSYQEVSTPFSSRDEIVNVAVDIPCNIQVGAYFWRGVLVYSVHGIQKSTSWYSMTFNIRKKPAVLSVP